MARPIRIEFEGAVYHVTSRGNERRKIFYSKKDYEKFKEYVGEAKEKYRFILHGYVLMTNHYHLLIETPPLIFKSFDDFFAGHKLFIHTNTHHAKVKERNKIEGPTRQKQ